jgi:hypothetical protein
MTVFWLLTAAAGGFSTAVLWGRLARRFRPRFDPDDEVAVALAVAKFYRGMSARLTRENDHYRTLAAERGAELDRLDIA